MFERAVIAACAALFVATAPVARADIIYNLNATATAADGSSAGTVTGSFTTNDARSTVISYEITASAVAGTFLGFTYTPSSSLVTSSTLPSQFFRLDSQDESNELQLFFSSGLGTDGGILSTGNSYENERSGGSRFLSGSVTAAAPTVVPEPASLLLLGVGALGLGMVRRRRA